MKAPRFRPRQKLRATARRLPQPAAMENFEQEPNISFTKALAVVVILHIVALAGIITFSSIKAHRIPQSDPELRAVSSHGESTAKRQDKIAEPPVKAAVQAVSPAVNSHVYQIKEGDTLARIAIAHGVSLEALEEANGLKNVGAVRIGQQLRIPVKPVPKAAVEAPKQTEAVHKKTAEEAVKPADTPSAATAKSSGNTYVVAKGDNPVAIARKLHVSYEALLKLNNIEDPKKLKIGQKLKVPEKKQTPAVKIARD